MEDRLRGHFAFVYKNMDCFLTMYRGGRLAQLHQKFAVFLPCTMPVWTNNAVEQAYRSRYIIAGIEAIEQLWVERGFQETLDEVVAMALRAQEQQRPL